MTLLIYLIIMIFVLIFLISLIPRKVKRSSVYTCGESVKFEKPENLFYKTLANILRLKKLQKLNTGNLDDYLLMIFICFMLLLIIMVII
jgi:hypothetical protein